ncbi:MAG TPA: sugar phosphate isomerase/epimerase [Streptosporangiales bacterium]
MSTSADVPETGVVLSTGSVYPESTATAFEIAARLGFDGVEVMVSTDPVSQDVDALQRLSDYHEVPIRAIHAPCLLITQFVWGNDPWVKIERSREAAERLGSEVVVIHPPFRWQFDYARDFVGKVARLQETTEVALAVENMYPWRGPGGITTTAYAPHWSPVDQDYANVTLDLSHAAVSHSNSLEMAKALGDRVAHVHLADGTGSKTDEHLVPGRGTQPCDEVLEHLATNSYGGMIVLEVNTRRAESRADREADLAESLAFARLHLSAALDDGDHSAWRR